MKVKVSSIMPFGLRAPDEIMAWVKAKADSEQRSMNFVVTQILARAKAAEETACN